jgi:hypothetical protein
LAINPVPLLGNPLPVTVLPGAEGSADAVLNVIQATATLLNQQSAQLDDVARKYLGALRGFGVSQQRSFTPCRDTAYQEDGLYVFFLGEFDVLGGDDAAGDFQNGSNDARWWASCMIHDGGHAWLSQQGQIDVGVDVEKALTQVQIDYYNAVGGPASYIQYLQTYMNNNTLILARIAQPVDGAIQLATAPTRILPPNAQPADGGTGEG